jgi:hypothetical protein
MKRPHRGSGWFGRSFVRPPPSAAPVTWTAPAGVASLWGKARPRLPGLNSATPTAALVFRRACPRPTTALSIDYGHVFPLRTKTNQTPRRRHLRLHTPDALKLAAETHRVLETDQPWPQDTGASDQHRGTPTSAGPRETGEG